MGPICSTCVHTQIHLHYMCKMYSQTVQPFDHISQSFELLTPPPNPPTPQMPPWGMVGRLVFSLCTFPDESTDVYQIWCQSVQPFGSFPRLEFVTPQQPPSMPPGVLRGELYLAYVHYQTNPQTGTKFGANRYSRLTASQYFWNDDPLNPPGMPPGVLRGELYLAYVHSQANPQTYTNVGANRSSRLTASLEFWICHPLPPPPPPEMPPGALWGEMHWAYVHSQLNPQTWTKVVANRSSRLTASTDFWMFDPLTPQVPPPPPCLEGQFVWPMSIPRWISTCVPHLVPIGQAVWQLPQTF